jgi:hypothetical protein
MTATTTPRKRAAKKAAAGPDRIPKRSQGFYRDPETGEKYRSVTTILNQGVPKDALPFWAGNVVAESAMAHLPMLVKASRDPKRAAEAYDWLRRAHTRKKEERGEEGSATHKFIEHELLGTPIPQDLLDNPEVAPLLPRFREFVADFKVEFDASEMVVANDDEKYAGCLDYLVRSALLVDELVRQGLLPEDADRDVALMGDTKTGGELCTGDRLCVRMRPSEFKACPGDLHSLKGVYAEAGLQMSAYRAARIAWLRDGTKVPMPATHPVGIVLHLRPEGYLVHPALCDDTVFDHFRHARRVAEWTSGTSKTVLGQAIGAPTTTKRGAA